MESNLVKSLFVICFTRYLESDTTKSDAVQQGQPADGG